MLLDVEESEDAVSRSCMMQGYGKMIRSTGRQRDEQREWFTEWARSELKGRNDDKGEKKRRKAVRRCIVRQKRGGGERKRK